MMATFEFNSGRVMRSEWVDGCELPDSVPFLLNLNHKVVLELETAVYQGPDFTPIEAVYVER